MKTMNPSAAPESRPRFWLRVLRPLFLWLLFVLVLFGIRTHQRWLEKTRLNFSITLAGKPLSLDATTIFDGKPIASGQKIPLGHHQFTVTHPKGESYSTNLFVWYGTNSLGNIDLKRTMSALMVMAVPPAPLLYIHGPEFDVTLTNSPGLTSSVPTDRYVVSSRYAHWSESDEVPVSAGVPAMWRIAPRLGAAQITCNEADATGQFLQADGQVIESITFPYAIYELPEGTYQVLAQHRNDALTRTVTIAAKTTNQLALEFLYGEAVLETEPPGATVRTDDGHFWGVTPLKLVELKPGTWTFLLQHDGYESVTAPLAIAVNQSSRFQTNLTSVGYTGSMIAAQSALNAEDFEGALKAVGDALIAKPGDAEALGLQRKATGFGSLQRAKKLGTQGDFIGGQIELATTLAIFPDHTEAKALLAEYKRREPDQREKMRLTRLNRPRALFMEVLKNYADASLFDEYELKTSKPFNTVGAAIASALKSGRPAFQITGTASPQPETCVIEAGYEITGYLGAGTTSGRRRCVIVCGQTKDDETQILFKVFEYKAKTSIKFSLANLLNTATTDNVYYLPINPNRIEMTPALQSQLTNGVQMVTERIQSAIGLTPAASAP